MFKNLFNDPEGNKPTDQDFVEPSFTEEGAGYKAPGQAAEEASFRPVQETPKAPQPGPTSGHTEGPASRPQANPYLSQQAPVGGHASQSAPVSAATPTPQKPQKRQEVPKKEKVSLRERWRRIGNGISRAWAIAGTVIAISVLVLAIFGIIFIAQKISLWSGNMDTPEEAGKTIIKTLEKDDFTAYQKLLASDAVTANDRAVFDALQESLDNPDQTLVSNFILIRLENGKQYLVSLYFDDDRGKYVIREMKEVPVNMQNIFVS